MNRTVLAALAAIIVASAMTAPASAQTVSGGVTLTGAIAARCGTVDTGSTSVSGSINLGELSASTGELNPVLVNSTTNSPAGAAVFRLGCSGSAFRVTLSASRLDNIGFPPVDPPGSSVVDYTVEAKIALATGGFALVDYTTAAATPAPTVQTVNSFVANLTDNFDIRVFGFHPDNGDAALMVAGSYSGDITFLVAPLP